MTSSLPGGPGSTAASSTYIRSQYNLNPPPQSHQGGALSPDPPGGYCPGPGMPLGSEGPPSTIGDFNWGNTTGSSLDGGSVLGSCSGCHHNSNCHPGGHPQAVYLSSAMSTSSADSGSISGSGSRTCGSNSGGSGSAGGGSRRPSNFKSFSQGPCHNMSQPKAVFVRPGPPSSPFKRPLLSSTPCSSETPELPSPGDPIGATVNPRGLNFTPLPAMAEVRSPEALHPEECDCLSQGIQVRVILTRIRVLGDSPNCLQTFCTNWI